MRDAQGFALALTKFATSGSATEPPFASVEPVRAKWFMTWRRVPPSSERGASGGLAARRWPPFFCYALTADRGAQSTLGLRDGRLSRRFPFARARAPLAADRASGHFFGLVRGRVAYPRIHLGNAADAGSGGLTHVQ
jgi:hypothetical protein